MEDLILKIAEQLLGVSIGFVGLVFTSLSILMTLKDENWKIKKLKRTNQFKEFVELNTNTAIGFIIFFIFSIIVLILKKVDFNAEYLLYILYCYMFYLAILSINVIKISHKYKQIIILMLDDSKPIISE